MADAILPHASSGAERALDAAAARRLGALDPGLVATLWNPGEIPAELLPALAWALSIDEWDPAWTVAQKRAAVRAAAELHRIKGTDRAVLGALRTVGIDARIEDWHDHLDDPTWHSRTGEGKAKPFTFRIVIEDLDDDARVGQLRRVVDATKRASAHYEVLTLGELFEGPALALAAAEGESLLAVQNDIDIGADPKVPSPALLVGLRVLAEDGSRLAAEDGSGVLFDEAPNA